MTATTTPTRTKLTFDEYRALRIRQRAAMKIIDTCEDEKERWDLLVAVVWPSDPLLGLASRTSSATESS